MTEAQIVGLLDRYVRHVIVVDVLERALPDGWELDQLEESERETRRLVLRVVGLIAEFRNGDRTEQDLREAVRSLIARRNKTDAPVRVKLSGPVALPTRYFAKT